jgi:hypothetical protein
MRFVIIAMPRTGSSHLVSMLARHDEISCHGEVFHKNKVFLRGEASRNEDIQNKLARLRSEDWRGFLNAVFALDYGRAHCGFKIFKSHHAEALEHILAEDNIRKIVLFRPNVLANFSSAMTARQTGNYAQRPFDRAERQIVHFEERTFERFCKRYTEFYRTIGTRLSRQSVLHISYEDINNPLLWARLEKFLGVSPFRLPAQERPARTLDVLARFANPGVVTKYLDDRALMHWRNERENRQGPLGAPDGGLLSEAVPSG